MLEGDPGRVLLAVACLHLPALSAGGVGIPQNTSPRLQAAYYMPKNLLSHMTPGRGHVHLLGCWVRHASSLLDSCFLSSSCPLLARVNLPASHQHQTTKVTPEAAKQSSILGSVAIPPGGLLPLPLYMHRPYTCVDVLLVAPSRPGTLALSSRACPQIWVLTEIAPTRMFWGQPLP